jgi:hypothetical protein
MELSVDAMINEVRGFLRGLGFREPALLERIATRIAGGLEHQLKASGSSVRELLSARVAEWLAPHFDAMPREKLLASARAAFLEAGAAERWPDAFLGNPPREMVEALQRALPCPTPAEALAAMPEQSLAPAGWLIQLAQLWSPQAQGSWNS